MLVKKVISGGQTGADQAGLRAARDCGIATSGTAPRNFMTEDGPNESLADFGLIAKDLDYKGRTIENVKNSDGTIIFAEHNSRGSDLTAKVCRFYRKPYWINPDIGDIKTFVELHNIEVLNIAGNRESVSLGIGERVYGLLIRALKYDPDYEE